MRTLSLSGKLWLGVWWVLVATAGGAWSQEFALQLPANPLPTNPLPTNPATLPPAPTFTPSTPSAPLGAPSAPMSLPANTQPAGAQPAGNVLPLPMPGPSSEPASPSSQPAPPHPATTTTTQSPPAAHVEPTDAKPHKYRRKFCGSGHHFRLEFHFVDITGTVAYTISGHTYVATLKYVPTNDPADASGMTYNVWHEAPHTGHPHIDAWRIARRPHCGTYAVHFRMQDKWYIAPVMLHRTVAE